MRSRLLLCASVALLACTDREPPAPPPGSNEPGPVALEPAPLGWSGQDDDLLEFRDIRTLDFTGDGAAEQIAVTARGPSFDELDIRLVITRPDGQPLWVDGWRSDFYFAYDDRRALPDSSAARIVRGHINALLADSAFHDQGLPPRFATGYEDMLYESVQYHLAELDWRRAADLEPGDPTPPDAHNRIRAGTVPHERVAVVIREAMGHPTFMYYGGGEVSTLLGWSEREGGFVRLFHCC